MGSNALISTLRTRPMPFLAILRHDLRSLMGSWLVRLWLAGTALLTFIVLLSNWTQFRTAPLIASLLVPYLVFPWFLVVIVLGVNPVSGSRVEALADGLMSRPVTRWEYLLAAWSARVVLVLGVYLVVLIPAIVVAVMAKRPVADDSVTLYGVIAAVGVVGLVLTLQVSLGFLLGTLLRHTLLAITVLVFLWYPVNLLLHTFSLEEFSPISLNQAIPTLLRQPWRETEADSEMPSNSEQAEAEAVARQAAAFMSVLSGTPQRAPEPVKPGFFEHKEYEDFSLKRVVLGYGIPTLLAVGLALLCFNLRDL